MPGRHAQPASALSEPDYMATEFVWIPKHARPAGFHLAGSEQAL